MARSLLAVLTDEVSGLSWLSPAARQQALAKLASYGVKVGYPDTWTDFSALTIGRDAFWANVAAARRFGVETDRRRVGTRTSREQWQLPPSSPDAYIDPQLNLMVLPAGFLQPPAFDPAATDAANYGAIGAGMAHDLTHALDLLGADFDAAGQPRNWWTDADRKAFEELGRCVVEQYDGYAIEPGIHLDGKRVRGEAIGDMAGLRIAYLALGRSIRSKPVPSVNGESPEQQFFIALAQHRGAAETLDLQRQLVRTDSHAVAKYRVNGRLWTAPEFHQAFACAAGSPMMRSPGARCSVW